jgi:Tol biopolymer transport system component
VRSSYKTLSVDLASGEVAQLIAGPTTVAAYQSPLLFVESPDGTRLAYACGWGDAATPTPSPPGSHPIVGDLCIWGPEGQIGPPAAAGANVANPGLLAPDAWSPEGRRLILRDQLLIGPPEPPTQSYLLELDTGKTTRLLGGMQVGHAQWSRDSEQVAFANELGLFVVDLATGTSVNVAESVLADEPDYGVGDFAWAPDGSSIAFTLVAAGHVDSPLYVASADGASARKIGTGAEKLRWSPDGQWIALARRGEGTDTCKSGAQCSVVHVVRADGSEDRAITPSMADASAPVWSPDSARVAFRGSKSLEVGSDGFDRVYVTDVTAGGQAKAVSGDVWATASPDITWSEDGERLVFIGYPAGTGATACGRGGCADGDLFMVEADGSEAPRQLYVDGVHRILRRP